MKSIEMNEEEASNLLGCLIRLAATEHHNGDWFAQLASKCYVFLKEEGVKVVTNNYGDHIRLSKFDDIWSDIVDDNVTVDELIEKGILGDNL